MIVRTTEKFAIVSKLVERFKKSHKTVDVDGIRVIFEKGWGLVRASNTQPVLVMRFEAETDALLKQYRKEVETALGEAQAQVG